MSEKPTVVERLAAEDARILALESGTIRGHTCKVIVAGGQHGAEEVRAHVLPRLGAFPRLRQRLAPSAGAPAWIEDPDFAIERHVVARGSTDDQGLRGLVAEAMTTPLDREHPLWAMDIVPLIGGRTAIVWRIHHAVADGLTAMRMARGLLVEDAGEPPGVVAKARALRPPERSAPVRNATVPAAL